jgi:hypothetical protein
MGHPAFVDVKCGPPTYLVLSCVDCEDSVTRYTLKIKASWPNGRWLFMGAVVDTPFRTYDANVVAVTLVCTQN